MKITQEHFLKFTETFDDDTQFSIEWKDTYCFITTLQFCGENSYKMEYTQCGIGYFNKEENFEELKELILRGLELQELQKL